MSLPRTWIKTASTTDYFMFEDWFAEHVLNDRLTLSISIHPDEDILLEALKKGPPSETGRSSNGRFDVKQSEKFYMKGMPCEFISFTDENVPEYNTCVLLWSKDDLLYSISTISKVDDFERRKQSILKIFNSISYD